MKRHNSHWHGYVVLVQTDGVVSKCISLQKGFCKIAGPEKMPGFLVHPVSSRLGGRAATGATQVVEQHPADISMLIIELCLSAFI